MFSPLRIALAPALIGVLAASALGQWSHVEEAALDSTVPFGGNCGFGHAVDLDGIRAAVGVPHPGAGGAGGHVVVYRRTNGVWTQEADLVASDTVTGNYFGWSVALEGNVLVVGSLFASTSGESGCGAAYVFRRNGTSWTQEQKLLASDPLQGAEFGYDVAINGSTLLVGGPHQTYANDGGRGAAYVFDWNGASWTQVAKLAGSGTGPGARNGSSVAIDGDRLVEGARTSTEDGGFTLGTGSGWVFRRVNGVWTEETKLQSTTYQQNGTLGISAAIEGTRVALGASGEEFFRGAAYVFEKSGATWVQKARVTGQGTDAQDYFGWSIDLSGNVLVAGCYRYDNSFPSGTGAVKLFAWDGAQWSEELELLGSVMTGGDDLGEAVAIQGDLVIGGSPSVVENQIGKAWIWNVEPPANEAYCSAKQTAHGCLPAITWSGTASATAPAPFLVGASQITPNQPGLLLYGFDPQSLPFHGGTLCVKAPVKRTTVQNSGGSGTCSGSYSYDFNARIQSGIDPALVPGEDVYLQYWFRDPQSPDPVGLSNALRCRIQP